MLKAVLFDMGDTLLQREPHDPKQRTRLMSDALHAAIARKHPTIKLPPPGVFDAELDEINKRYHPVYTCERQLGYLVAETGWPVDPDDPDLLTAWHRPLVESSRPAPDLAETLDTLLGMGLRLGIISNTQWRGPYRDQELLHVGILQYFPVRIYSADVHIEKPDPRIFAAGIAAMGGLEPGEVLYVGDNLRDDVGGAHGAGMRAAWLAPPGTTPPPAGEAHPDLLLTALSELPVSYQLSAFSTLTTDG